MNRSIKFRAWNNEDNRWDYSDFDPVDFWYGIGDGLLERNTLGQFTGLLDKNGREIYEGDIVEILVPPNFMESEYDLRGTVLFSPPAFFLDIKMPFLIGDKPGYTPNFSDCKVLGNIFENPELLK